MTGTLKDVARAAGVSLATASRVLSGSSYPVRPELRERVLAKARAVDYVPNAQARALITGRSGTVGFLVGRVGDPYFDTMAHGVQTVAQQHDLLVTIVGTDRDPDRELANFRLLQSHGAGIVIVGGSGLETGEYAAALTERIRSFTRYGGVTVLLGRHDVDPDLPVVRIEVDNHRAGRLLGAHLADLGHERVGVLAGGSFITSAQDRVAGITEGLGREPLVRQVRQTRDGGYAGAPDLIAEGVTALACTSDQLAIGALAYARDTGIGVPGELSVVGCNDIWVARDVTPALTTVRLPLAEMGAAALREALDFDGEKPVHCRFPVELVVRGSSARAA